MAVQIAEELEKTKHFVREFDVCKVYGGVSIDYQIRSLRHNPEFIVGTTGRVMDLFNRKEIDFSNVEALVLDEADRMLDMGFLPDIENILKELEKASSNFQMALFSATIPSWV